MPTLLSPWLWLLWGILS